MQTVSRPTTGQETFCHLGNRHSVQLVSVLASPCPQTLPPRQADGLSFVLFADCSSQPSFSMSAHLFASLLALSLSHSLTLHLSPIPSSVSLFLWSQSNTSCLPRLLQRAGSPSMAQLYRIIAQTNKHTLTHTHTHIFLHDLRPAANFPIPPTDLFLRVQTRFEATAQMRWLRHKQEQTCACLLCGHSTATKHPMIVSAAMGWLR